MSSLPSPPWKQRWPSSPTGSRPNTGQSLRQLSSASASIVRARAAKRLWFDSCHQTRTCPSLWATDRQPLAANFVVEQDDLALADAPLTRAAGGVKNGWTC